MTGWLAMAAGFAGGLGLFLLGMWLMTEGLKLAAGHALERILSTWTRTRFRGLLAGILVTSLVQSSSAVTVAAIGFVNAGLLSLGQTVWLIFGANVGTTMTGWLVALIGINIRIEAFALPLLGVGMLLRLTGEGARRGAIGTALAGFGTLFLGIDILKDSFSGLGQEVRLEAFAGEGWSALLLFIAIGVLLTTLMQSSSAALAIALTAAAGGLIPLASAAAITIGANVGTTVTAMLAVIGATSNAKRAAAAHVLFNLLTAVVALLILPWLLALIGLLGTGLGLAAAPATTLALFHTVFNLLGVLLMWPLSARLVRELERRFRTAEEDESRPRHLDVNVLPVPPLALDALVLEVQRVSAIARRMMLAVLSQERMPGPVLTRDKAVVDRLTIAIGEFAAQLYRTRLSIESAERLPGILRVARYYDATATIATDMAMVQIRVGEILDADVRAAMSALRASAAELFGQADTADARFSVEAVNATLVRFEEQYQNVKEALLRAGAAGRIPVVQMESLLQLASFTRRAVQQMAKGAQHLAPQIKTAPSAAGA